MTHSNGKDTVAVFSPQFLSNWKKSKELQEDTDHSKNCLAARATPQRDKFDVVAATCHE